MNASLKITKIGNSAGVVLPKELLAKLRAGVGDTLYMSETPDGIRITAADPSFEAKMALAEQIMREDGISCACWQVTWRRSPSLWIETGTLSTTANWPSMAGRRARASTLESALGRPRNQWAYGETDLCQLAAAYAYGVARNHPFTDGNKRTAWVLARLFLALNDVQIGFASRPSTWYWRWQAVR
jgi:putative addiction module antidote